MMYSDGGTETSEVYVRIRVYLQRVQYHTPPHLKELQRNLKVKNQDNGPDRGRREDVDGDRNEGSVSKMVLKKMMEQVVDCPMVGGFPWMAGKSEEYPLVEGNLPVVQ